MEVVKGRLPVQRIIASVGADAAGGTVIFMGTVRDRSDGRRVARMEVESAADLAERDLKRICEAARGKCRVSRISVAHRIGRLSVGDAIVVIAVSAPHREDAFSACRYIIDELKKTTPIWKKEFGPRGSKWVDAEVA